MSAFYDLASLVVVPSGYKTSKVYAQKPLTTDGQLTFSRASTATRVNSAGLIEASAINVPRLDYLNSTCPKLLLEPSRTNAVLHSSDFTNGAYTLGSNAVVTSNTATSPNGTQDADTFANTTGTSTVFLFQYVTGLTAQTVTASVFAKKNTNKYLGISLTGDNSASSRYQAIFNLETGAFAQAKNSTTPLTGQSYKIENYGNGWYRCTVTATFAISAKPYAVLQNSNILSANFDPNTLDWSDATLGSIYIWGMQAEGASYGTSIIPTTTAAVTRLADAASKTGISSIFGATATTYFMDVIIDNLNPIGGQWTLTAASDSSNFLSLSQFDAGTRTPRFAFFVGGSSVFDYTGSALTAGRHKIAAMVKNGSQKFYIDGVLIASNTGSGYTQFDKLSLNDAVWASPLQNGQFPFNQVLIFPTELTNAQLAELTTI